MDSQIEKRLEYENILVRNTKKEIAEKIKGEIWKYHELGDEFLKKHQPTSHLIDDVNALCMKSHNEALESLIKYLNE